MLKKVAGGLLLLAILGYVTGIATNHAYVYILAFVMLVAAILFMLLVLAVDLIWKLLPADFKKTCGGGKGRFTAIIFFSILLFYIVKGIIDEFCLPDASGFISLLGNTTIFVFVAFLAWSLIRQGKAKTIVVGSVAFILFIALLSFVSSTALKSGEVAQVSSIDSLKTLGYVTWVSAEKNIEKSGVVLYDPELAFEGVNLYSSQTSQEAYLIDMHGNVVHKWAKDVQGCGPWGTHVEMRDNGDLLVIILKPHMLVWLDWDSNLKAKKKILAHHDVCFDEDGNINMLAKKREVVYWHRIPVPIISDYIVVMSPQMNVRKEVSIYNLVEQRFSLHNVVGVYKAILKIFEPKSIVRILMLKTFWYKKVVAGGADILHTNSLEVMDRDIEGFCKKGDWLISIKRLDLIGIIDAKKDELGWTWGPGELSWQHHPTLLKNGNVLIFDNGCIRRYSRIVELNPLTKKIIWEYKSDPPGEFYSPSRGSNQRLPNGNTLITESDKGHVFEVTKEGKIVWDFYIPNVGLEQKKRETLYRMMRVIDLERYPHLGKLK